MAKNDMEVIMYKILRYLYECMKLGVEPELEQFAWNSKLFDIPQSYWCKIIVTLVRKGYITGFAVIDKTKDAPMLQTDRPFEITFEGVQFLEENSRMQKAKRILCRNIQRDLVCITWRNYFMNYRSRETGGIFIHIFKKGQGEI